MLQIHMSGIVKIMLPNKTYHKSVFASLFSAIIQNSLINPVGEAARC